MLAARVAGSTTLTEIRDFGRVLQRSVLQDPGMPLRRQAGHNHAPSISTPRHALKDVDVEKLEDQLTEWARIQATGARRQGPKRLPLDFSTVMSCDPVDQPNPCSLPRSALLVNFSASEASRYASECCSSRARGYPDTGRYGCARWHTEWF